MRATNLFAPTLRDAPREAELVSHKLLLRGGFIRALASGVYSYLPLGLRVLNKISGILRREMDAAGGVEMLMPSLVPVALLEESGRDKVDVLFHVKENDAVLGFTHEEVLTDIIRRDVQSYKQLPLALYQIQVKFRNEARPRGGLVRGREFLMLDAYSYDRDADGAHAAFVKIRDAFARMFARLGLQAVVVEADSGAMGGTQSAEFMVISADGEDTVLRDQSGYAANAERCEALPAPVAADAPAEDAAVPALERVQTPGAHTIADVAAFLKIPPTRLIKALVVNAPGGEPVLVLVRGDRDVEDAKLARALGGASPLADAATVERVTGAGVGFAGPVGLKLAVRVLADREVEFIKDGVIGANETDAHFVHAVPGRDFPAPEYADIRRAVDGDASPAHPGEVLQTARGIEVGHVFNLGTRYSDALGATFNEEGGAVKPLVMGSYGIGVSRALAAAVEQHHDESGIVWPIVIAPFAVVVVPVSVKDDAQRAAAEMIYANLAAQGIDVLIDDRDERPGVKFKDWELIGVPIQVVVGKGLADGVVEVSLRRDRANKEAVPVNNAVTVVTALVAALHAEVGGEGASLLPRAVYKKHPTACVRGAATGFPASTAVNATCKSNTVAAGRIFPNSK